MSEVRYIISDASKRVDVESHVLRYWEEELDLDIPRNEMGHRYYREEDIQILTTVKVLKEQGFQLKAIKMILPDINGIEKLDPQSILKLREELNEKATLLHGADVIVDKQEETVVLKQETEPVEASAMDGKMGQFQTIMNKLIVNALKENNQELSEAVSTSVSGNVIKEIDYLFRLKEEQEEIRFKKLDEVIRGYQKNRQEVAATDSKPSIKKKKRRLFKK